MTLGGWLAVKHQVSVSSRSGPAYLLNLLTFSSKIWYAGGYYITVWHLNTVQAAVAVYFTYHFIFRICLFAAMQEVVAEWRSCDETGSDVPTIQSNLFFMVESLILGREHMTTDQLQLREASMRVVSLVLSP